jgi:hypothetical protein
VRLRDRVLALCLVIVAFFGAWSSPSSASSRVEPTTPPELQVTRFDAEGITLEFRLPSIETKDVVLGGRTFRSVEIPGGGTMGPLGQPELPIVSRFVALPRGAEATVEATVLEEETLPGFLPAPVQAKSGANSFAFDADAYARDDFGSAPLVRLGQSAVLRDLRIAPLVFQPIRYNTARGEARVARRMRIDVRFRVAGGEGTPVSFDPSERTEPRPIAPSFDALYRHLVINHDQALEAREVRSGAWVVISPDDANVTSRLAPLLEWRRREGIPVRLATTAETGTTKEAIRAWLRQAWQNWDTPPEYVVLAGDAVSPYMIPTWIESLSGSNGEGDHPYTQLDSDDVLPEVHLGRLSFNTLTELDVIVAKIVSYESAPSMTDPSWFRRACLIGDLGEFAAGWSSMLLQQWVKTRLLGRGYAEVDTVFDPPVVPGMSQAMNRGDTIVSYRGTYRMSGWTNTMTYSLTNGWKLPFVVAITCATGSFLNETSLSEGFLRANLGGNPRGGIGMIGTATIGTHTRYNNCFQFGVLQGLLYEGQTTLGSTLTRGKLEMYANYEATEPIQVAIWCHWNNLMGDPATDCWTGYPEPLTVTHPAVIAVGSNSATVQVQRQGAPEPGALVCLWDGVSGQFTATTDAAGQAEVPITASTPGDMKITVTRHDRHPYLATIPVTAQPVYIGFGSLAVDDDASGESSGNGDGQVNPTEGVELRVALRNSGSALAPGVSAILTGLDPYVTIADSDEEYGDIAPGSTVWGADDFGFSVSGACPDGHVIRFGLEVHSGASTWHSLIEVPVVAPALTVEAVQVSDAGGNGLLDPGESGSVMLTLRNAGGMNASGVQGQIASASPWVTVSDDSGSFGPIAVGQTGTNGSDLFAVTAAPQAYRGAPAQFRLITTSNGGMADTSSFVIRLGQAATLDPTGPDGYGYFALDNTDVSYTAAPAYDWTEIDPAYGGDGAALPLDDFELHRDKSVTVDLPFTFQFLGRPYAQATICSNGWIAMGSTYLAEYRNWSIPGAGAPENLIAVFWDDLYTARGAGRVLRKYDATGRCLIIEWSHLVNQQTGHPEETFQAVLYDPAYYPTPSGDGMIDCRYQTVANVDQEDGYATVGIQSADHTDGVLYTYANRYSPGAAPLVNGRAVRFYPALAAPRGVLEGTVSNASWAGAPAGGVDVRVLQSEGTGTSDPDGHYRLSLPEGVYTVVAGNESFTPDTVSGVVVSLSQPARVDFSLIDTSGPVISEVTQFVHTPSTGPYPIEATVTDYSTVAGATLCWRRSGGSWTETAMSPDGSIYRTSIATGAPRDLIEYTIRAQDGIGRTATSPPDAPGELYQFWVTTLVYAYNVEGSPIGWMMGVPGDNATGGIWQQGLPHEIHLSTGEQISPGEDHTPPPGRLCMNTGGTMPIVSGGCTTLQTPFFNLRLNSGAWVGFYRWFGNFGGSIPFTTKVTNDGGAGWNPLSSELLCQNWWQLEDLRIDQTVPLTDQVAFRFMACVDNTGGFVSASLDDFWIEALPPDPAGVADVGPSVFALLPVRPNPNPRGGVSVTFSLERAGDASLAVYDVGGRLVKMLRQGPALAGAQSVFWDGRTEAGMEAGAGVFFCRLEAQGRTRATRIVRVR